jgi:hypothetical protein
MDYIPEKILKEQLKSQYVLYLLEAVTQWSSRYVIDPKSLIYLQDRFI